MDLQACIPATLTAIYNFICIYNLKEITSFNESADLEQGFVSGELAAGQTGAAEKRQANIRWNKIAKYNHAGLTREWLQEVDDAQVLMENAALRDSSARAMQTMISL